MDVVRLNRQAWDKQSTDAASAWVVPVDTRTIEQARQGHWSVILTPNKAVPAHWFDGVRGKRILGLASGGGQQMPVLAAAGARVTSFDNSPVQLEKDARVAELHKLQLTTVRGDMADLSQFGDQTFDLIFHPVSNVFAPDILPVWLECARVLKPGGRLLSGFMNPCFFLFDHDAIEAGAEATVAYKLPFNDLEAFSEQDLRQRVDSGNAIEFSHSLEEQLGGQLDAGLVIRGFYEDHWNLEATPLDAYMPTSMATLSIKPS